MSTQQMESRLRPVLYIIIQNNKDAEQVISIPGWDVKEVRSIESAQACIATQQYDVGLIQLEETSGKMLQAMETLITQHRAIEWVVLTNEACLQQTPFCKFIRETCYDYVTLPLSDSEYTRLLFTLGHAYGMARLTQDDGESTDDEYEMVGCSPSMMKLFGAIRRVASVDASVLICGESGTGKELIAHAIHERSSRASMPFVAVNCGAIPENLIQSELFGYEKGAFTGANKQKLGQIEVASGGTLFLDEVGDLPYDMQVNLLRFLQEQVIQRLGGNEEICVDVRVLAATNIDLDAAVKQGRFREDLLYRLNVLQLSPPALRDREGDIEVMARFFFDRFVSEGQARLKGFSQQALLAMQQYSWPGNVRELINRVRRAIVMCDGRLITPEDLGLADGVATEVITSLEDARELAEKEAITHAVQYCRHNMTQSAKLLGVSRVTLYRMMEKYSLGLSMETSVK
ncbi:sigma-54 dependent transcriptional regulator [Amphritea sp. 1_MG-2023]|uniref:sigma-54 dependent transcriptional regulator n=1 Tax=Amphritea sp. 1_MG-2023 TaxID=3062670 RepID=UPI0026E39829|nr:sigma-54 dependent transcriptional regulator [Amphritea sp. 1_MG-2023]MDO6565013.1 sigma-54 dependent transcriptional regulator [Amphritea sp. 1_MG-2023]